jgi:hypothetical protein
VTGMDSVAFVYLVVVLAIAALWVWLRRYLDV